MNNPYILIAMDSVEKLCLDVVISDGAKCYKAKALWDTGAVTTHISQKVVDFFALPVIGNAICVSASQKYNTTKHRINARIDNVVAFEGLVVRKLPSGVNNDDMIIGMDIIRQFDSAITRLNGKIFLSIQRPSKAFINFMDDK